MKKFLALILAMLLLSSVLVSCTPDEAEEVMGSEIENEEIIEEVVPDEFYLKMQNDERPIAVMIDNDADYKGPQAGLHKAYMIYEAYVEGGNTRMMALFKESFFDDEEKEMKIGPVRSSRHYFLDFALENDAIYAHCGWSPRAQSEISSRGVNNLNGLYEAKTFYRYSGYNNSWHNLYTDYERLSSSADNHGYSRDTEKTYNYLKNYEVPQDGNSALKVEIPYLQCNIAYEFDKDSNLYKRIRRGNVHKMQTEDEISVMNIVILEMQNVNLNDGEGKGRQDLYNTGSGKGKFITGGKAVDITWEKADRSGEIKFLKNGSEISLNPGLTFVQIVPPAMEITIE